MSAGDAVGSVFVSVAQTFGIVALGYLYGKVRGPDTKALTDVTMTIFVPALALTAILDAGIRASSLGLAVAAVLIVIAVSAAGGFVGLRGLRIRPGPGLLMPIAIVNSANIPFPLVSANFGPEGLGLAVSCYVTTNIVVFTLGIAFMSGTLNPGALVREPAFLATLAAVVLKLLGWGLPRGVDELAHLAGQGAIPAMLVILGQTLAGVRMGQVRTALAAVALRYGLGLAAGLTAVTVLGLSGLLRDIILFYAVLPSAVVNVVLARRYDRDAEITATTVLVSTVAAVVVLPLVLVAIKSGLPARIWN